MSRFNGSWTLTPAKGTLDVERRPGTYAVLEQDLLPAGLKIQAVSPCHISSLADPCLAVIIAEHLVHP